MEIEFYFRFRLKPKAKKITVALEDEQYSSSTWQDSRSSCQYYTNVKVISQVFIFIV